MIVLSINSGSTSLRWALFDVATEQELHTGAVEKVRDPSVAWNRVRVDLEALSPDAIGHRVVHGGERFTMATPIDEAVVRAIEAQIPLAPVHNPLALRGIREAARSFPGLPQVAVFDTAFHQSMPPEAYRYALPHSFYEIDRIRRYGFHGTSHRYAAERAAALLRMPPNAFNGVTVHLGGGCSITSIQRGRSIDTSMGMTPLEGLMMGTRSGDVDPGVVLDLVARPEFDPERIKTILNEESGLLGVSGLSSDLREVEKAADAGDERARIARDLFAYRVRRGIGAALAVLDRADAIVFTGGIGEYGSAMRERILTRLGGIDLELDPEANREKVGVEGRISTPDSRVAMFVVRARENWQIARETADVLSRGSAESPGRKTLHR